MYNLPVVIAGDWNMTWPQLEATGWPAQIGLELHDSAEIDYTCTTAGRNIDYFLISPELKLAVSKPKSDYDVPWGPHSVAVEWELVPNAHQVFKTVLRVPKALPIKLFKDFVVKTLNTTGTKTGSWHKLRHGNTLMSTQTISAKTGASKSWAPTPSKCMMHTCC